MTHIILLDGKLWAFEPPERPIEDNYPNEHAFRFDLEAYNRAYSLALEQKIEVENPDTLIKEDANRVKFFMDHCLLSQLKENEPIKWEGGYSIQHQIYETSGKWVDTHELMYSKFPDDRRRKLIRLIAPVKEGLIEKLNKVSDKLDAEDKGRRNLTSDQLAVNADAQHPKPVPSEQENQEPMVLEVIGNFLHSSGLVFDTNDADRVASDFIEYLKSEGLTIIRK